MNLNEQITQDIKDAMKSGNTEAVSILRLIRASIQKLEKDRQNPSHVDHTVVGISDADVIGCIQREIKQRNETLDFAKKAGRNDMVAEENKAIDFLNKYMPQQLTREEVVTNVQMVIDQVGNDFRAVMPMAANLLKGRANGKLVNEVVTEMTVKS